MHYYLTKLVFTKRIYDFFCHIQILMRSYLSYYDVIRIILAMMTLDYSGMLISSSPAGTDNTVRALIRKNTLRATNNP